MKQAENKVYRRSRISTKVSRRLIRAFAMDLTATDAAELTGLTAWLPKDLIHSKETRLHCFS